MTPTPPAGSPTDEELERLLHESRQLEDAPEWVIQRAIAAWKPRTAPAATPSLLDRVLAVLTFDSAASSPLAFGQRSLGMGPRQLFFAVDSHDIDLRMRPASATPGRWELAGQVLGPQVQGRVALIDGHGVRQGDVALSELGEFRLPPVAVGQFTLTIDLPDTRIVLPPVDVPDVG